MEETILGMCRMKEHAWKHGGTHSFPITEDMIKRVKETKRQYHNEEFCVSPCHKTGFFLFFLNKYLRLYFSLILIANKFYSILFLKINDQQLKDEEEKKDVDAAEKQKDEEKTKQAEAVLYESVKSLEDRDI